jgi:hypothetical protein
MLSKFREHLSYEFVLKDLLEDKLAYQDIIRKMIAKGPVMIIAFTLVILKSYNKMTPNSVI